MDYLASDRTFSDLSLADLLQARDQFHVHLLHKPNVVGTAVGRYLIRSDDPYPRVVRTSGSEAGGDGAADSRTTEERERDESHRPDGVRHRRIPKRPRTLENSEVRDYSWPCVLVFVDQWEPEDAFGAGGRPAFDIIPKTIYLEDGRRVPICVVLAPRVTSAPLPDDAHNLVFPASTLQPGYPLIAHVQGRRHIASAGCLVTDGHAVYVLTSRHVAGKAGEELFTIRDGKEVRVGHSAGIELGRMPFEQAYAPWPGRQINVNLDVGLIEVDDQTAWHPAVFGIGTLGPLADLSVYNLSLNLIGCPVVAHGAVSGRQSGRIAALFYRYKSVGGLEHIADFLIGSRDATPLTTRPGDSGTMWVMESDDVRHDRGPIGIQWGGTVFAGEAHTLPFALATNLSVVCRELGLDLYRSASLAAFEYWEAVGHYTVAALACGQVQDPPLRELIQANQENISFDPGAINTSVNRVTVPGFVPLANVPDKVWKKKYDEVKVPYGRKGPENPNHYADVDYAPAGKDTLDDLTPDAASLTPDAWRAYYKSVGWNAPSKRGLLPFRVWQIYKQMVEYARKKKIAEFVTAAGVLAHYVGDACQPLHTSILSDGDPFRYPDGNPAPGELGHGEGYGAGVHSAYEGAMLDVNVDQLLKDLPGVLGNGHGMALVTGGQEAGYAIVELARRCRAALKPERIVDLYVSEVKAGREGKAAAPALWSQFRKPTLEVMADGCRTLAMLWDSAWAEGGGGPVTPTKFQHKTLQQIYEDQDFVPSVFLGQIDQYL